MGLFSSIGKSISKGFSSLTKGFKSNPIGSILGMSGLPQSSSQWIPGGELLQSGFSDIGGTMSDLYDIYSGRDIAKKNYDLQKEQFEYQKTLNTQQMQREDTAMQRKVADLKAAGLNPILAANGTGASSAPLHAGPAPQMADTSGAGREGLAFLSNAVMTALSMRKDFAQKDAQIKLLQSEKDKVDAETAGIKTENEYKADWLNLRNENLDLENQLKSGTLQANIDLATSKLSISRKEELVKNMELMLGQADYDLKQVDLEISKLIKQGKITENQILDKKLEILTTEALQKALDYSNAEWDTSWYHGLNLPVGFNAGWMGQLSLMIGALGSNGIKIVSDLISSIFGDSSDGAGSSSPSKLSKAEIKQLLRRPVGSNILWTRNMIKNRDFGVRRNF